MISLSVFLFSPAQKTICCRIICEVNQMSLLDELSVPGRWEAFLEYRSSLCSKGRIKELEEFVSRREYLPVCAAIREGKTFPLPEKSVINKNGSQKKRVVYKYPRGETAVLKLLTHLILRRYDSIFSPGLFSFRPGHTAKTAVSRFTHGKTSGLYCYKADISNYFNSIPVKLLLPMLRNVLWDDPELYAFLSRLLTEPYVLERGRPICEQKGIMAGTPLSAFYANLFLSELDRSFYERNIPYARYSDDIIVFAKSREECEACADEIRDFLSRCGLSINPDKEKFSSPGEGWSFLGFCCCGNKIDIAPVTLDKLRHKMRRKSRALRRWSKRNDISGERAAAAFIRIFNRKLLEAPENNELSWSCWFFSVINTSESLHRIDLYAQDCIRWLISGKRTKARFDVRYDQLRAMGYRSLVNAYYSYSKAQS